MRDTKKYYDQFKHCSMKTIRINDVWLVKYPYTKIGGYYKIRPALVVGIDDEITVQKITTKNKGKEIKYRNTKMISYLTNDKIKIPDYMMIRKVGTWNKKDGAMDAEKQKN